MFDDTTMNCSKILFHQSNLFKGFEFDQNPFFPVFTSVEISAYIYFIGDYAACKKSEAVRAKFNELMLECILNRPGGSNNADFIRSILHDRLQTYHEIWTQNHTEQDSSEDDMGKAMRKVGAVHALLLNSLRYAKMHQSAHAAPELMPVDPDEDAQDRHVMMLIEAEQVMSFKMAMTILFARADDFRTLSDDQMTEYCIEGKAYWRDRLQGERQPVA
jgi:hypothetical protein